jgi:hypothetical protein
MKRLLIGLFLMVALGFSCALAQIQISEVDPATGAVELHNAGDEAVDVSSMFLCNRPAYAQLSSLEVVSGELTIPGHGYLVVTWAAVASADAELALYAEPSYGSADAIRDYLAWGSAGHGREGTAAEAGLWMAGSFLEAPAEGMTLSHRGTMEMVDDPAMNWMEAEPTLGESNSDMM